MKKSILFFLLGIATVVCIAALPTQLNTNQFNTTNPLSIKSGALQTNLVLYGTTTNTGALYVNGELNGPAQIWQIDFNGDIITPGWRILADQSLENVAGTVTISAAGTITAPNLHISGNGTILGSIVILTNYLTLDNNKNAKFLYTDGDGTVQTGSVFTGNGSGLTNIPLSGLQVTPLTNNQTGTIVFTNNNIATVFYADGSSLRTNLANGSFDWIGTNYSRVTSNSAASSYVIFTNGGQTNFISGQIRYVCTSNGVVISTNASGNISLSGGDVTASGALSIGLAQFIRYGTSGGIQTSSDNASSLNISVNGIGAPGIKFGASGYRNATSYSTNIWINTTNGTVPSVAIQSATGTSANLYVSGTNLMDYGYASNDFSALSFTDRSSSTKTAEEAWEAVMSHKATPEGKVDHSQLSPLLWGTKITQIETGRFITNVVERVEKEEGQPDKIILEEEVKAETRPESEPDQSKRDLSKTVSALLMALQDERAKREALEARITALEK